MFCVEDERYYCYASCIGKFKIEKSSSVILEKTLANNLCGSFKYTVNHLPGCLIFKILCKCTVLNHQQIILYQIVNCYTITLKGN